ncbi:MAG TPA: PIG-L family deacetylase [Bacteroidia bacterium]|nr:PIG-L family deacetylase [Bacteroidia bacterium]
MIANFKNIFVLAPHTDDGELGAGGTISKCIENGATVWYAAFSTAEESVPEVYPKDILKTEVKAATQKLGIKEENLLIFNYPVRKLNYVRQEILEELIKISRQQKFDAVFIPTLGDIHQDHSTIANEGLRAFKNTTLLGYELIWNNLSFNTQCFVKLEQRHIDSKVAALAEYKSQSHRDYMKKDFITSLAHARGIQIGARYAEAFEVLRWVMD